LRQGSYNKAALRAAVEEKPPGMTIETAEIGSIPLYNEITKTFALSGSRRQSKSSGPRSPRPTRCSLSHPNTTTRCRAS
jgi:hypothetical protein